MRAIELAPGIFHLGANILTGDLFEGLWPIPDGVSLNAYLVRGEKSALIDLVRDWDSAPQVLRKELTGLDLDFKDLDYLILNHMEPDHTGWLRGLLKQNPKIEICCTQKAAALLGPFFDVKENIRIVKDGDRLDLGGGKNLVFYEVPNVHWPETMATYDPDSGILFSCDAFGSFGALGDTIFDDEISQEKHDFYERETLRYYASIVSSFSAFVLRAIDKLKNLDIKIVAPSHGPVWRENPGEIIRRYITYANYAKGPAEPEITVIWGSMYGNTREVLDPVVRGIRSEGLPVHIHQVPNDDLSHILASAWKSTGIVMGMPTYEYKMFPPMAQVLDIFERKHVHNKKVFRFGSWGWSGGAQKEFEAKTEGLHWDLFPSLEWQGAPTETVLAQAYEKGRELAREVKKACEKPAG